MKPTPIIWVCHSSECEGTWIESTGNDADDKICPSVDCDNKNTTCYIPKTTVDELLEALKRSHGCATLRTDGTCDGCFVSEAIQKAEGKE